MAEPASDAGAVQETGRTQTDQATVPAVGAFGAVTLGVPALAVPATPARPVASPAVSPTASALRTAVVRIMNVSAHL